MDTNNAIAILLDTDIGSDIDDAVALSYLVSQPRCELVGVTTVSGDVDKRAVCACSILEAVGQSDIPVITGLREPLVFGPGQPNVPHYPSIAGMVSPTAFRGGAVEFMHDLIRSRPHEIVLLSIGPFTNVAALFASDPSLPALLAGYVSMGGTFPTARVPDWNPLVDPVAAAIAYRWSPPGHVSIGLNVTRRLQVTRAQAVDAFSRIPPLIAMCESWFQANEAITLHDPLAAAANFRPALCGYADGEVTVDLCGEMSGGTSFRQYANGRHRVATSVDHSAAIHEILGCIRGD